MIKSRSGGAVHIGIFAESTEIFANVVITAEAAGERVAAPVLVLVKIPKYRALLKHHALAHRALSTLGTRELLAAGAAVSVNIPNYVLVVHLWCPRKAAPA